MKPEEVRKRIIGNLRYLVGASDADASQILLGGNNNNAIITWSRILPPKEANEALDALERIGTFDYDPLDDESGNVRIGWTVQLPPQIGGALLLDLLGSGQ